MAQPGPGHPRSKVSCLAVRQPAAASSRLAPIVSHPLLHAGLSRRLLDHLIRLCEQVDWNCKTNLFCCLKVYQGVQFQSHLKPTPIRQKGTRRTWCSLRCRRAKHNSGDFDVILTGGDFRYRLESASQSAREAAPRSVLVLQKCRIGANFSRES